MTDLTVPDSVRPYAGRIIDADAHEMLPVQLWREEYGAVTDRLVETLLQHPANNPGGLHYPDYVADDMPIDPESVWALKGSRAPKAVGHVGRCKHQRHSAYWQRRRMPQD